MSMPVAKRGDRVVGIDTHVILLPSPAGPVPTPMPLPFVGTLQQDLSSTVVSEHQPVALVDSVALNLPPHIPLGGPFQSPPSNHATIKSGSPTVLVEHRALARANDPATCCNDPSDEETGHIVAMGTVSAG